MIKIVYYDGGVLTCNKLEDYGNAYYCDEYRIVYKNEINYIEYMEG